MWGKEDLVELTALLSKCPRVALRSRLMPDYLHVLDRLRLIGNNEKIDTNFLVAGWEGFGNLAGISEARLRAEAKAKAERERATPGDSDVEGCAWFKCVLYDRREDEILLFRCAGCDKAMYCSPMCQER